MEVFLSYLVIGSAESIVLSSSNSNVCMGTDVSNMARHLAKIWEKLNDGMTNEAASKKYQ